MIANLPRRRRAVFLLALGTGLVFGSGRGREQAVLAAKGAASPEVISHVLIVANNASVDANVRPLRFADDDGARYLELFGQVTSDVTLLAVLDPDTARVHPEAAAAAQVPWLRTLRREVARIARAVEKENASGLKTTFTFVYVGHGNVGDTGEGYLHLQDTRITRRHLFEEVIDRVPATTIHLLLDACKSYFLVARGPEKWRDDRSGRSYGEEVQAFLSKDTLERHPNVGAIVSTSGDEEVHEWSEFRSGIFSHELRSALAGAADINGDRLVEYSEVGGFIASANSRVTHERARLRPFVSPPASERHAPLFDLSRARRSPILVLGARLEGRVSVEDERGVRHADLNKAPGQRLELVLPGGRQYFVRVGGDEHVLPRDRVGLVALDSLARSGPRLVRRGSVDLAFQSDLFGAPFSRSFYDGFVATTDMPPVPFEAISRAEPELAPSEARGRLRVELSYALSPVALDLLKGVQHNVGLGARRGIVGPLYLAARAELGVSRHDDIPNASPYSLVRIALLGGAGLDFPIAPWIDLAIEADAGWMALLQTGLNNNDLGGAKFGTQLIATFRPLATLPRLGLVLRAGFFGGLVHVKSEPHVYLLPEGGAGLSYLFD
jgi:hypothetical protein